MKLMILLLSLCLAVGSGTAAEPVTGPQTLSGLFTGEYTGNGFALSTGEGIRYVIPQKNTVWETDGEFHTGDYVTVRYEGRADAKSVNAAVINRHVLKGKVSEMSYDGDGGSFLLTPETGEGSVLVNADEEQMNMVADGSEVTVFYDGKTTRSIPPQISAQYLRGRTLTGDIICCKEGMLLMEVDGYAAVVWYTEDTPQLVLPEPGIRVEVSVTELVTLSMPPQFRATDILPG